MTRHRLVAVGVTLAIVVSILVLVASGSRGRADATPASRLTPSAVVSGSIARAAGAHDGVAVAGDEPGARRAALVYASSSQRWLYLDDDAIRRAVHAAATTAGAERLTDAVLEQVSASREALLGAPRVWWVVRPLATRITQFDGRRARVEVWVVTVLSAVDVAEPQADWTTTTLELRWERGGWRIADVDDSAGPTPAAGPRDRPWTAARVDHALDGFVRVGVGE